MIISARIAGIPCKIDIVRFEHKAPNYSYSAETDLDFYGYTIIDYRVLDRRGRPAPWLERKLDERERDALELHITEVIRG